MRNNHDLIAFILPILIMLFIFQCAPTQEDVTKIRDAIKEVNANFIAKINEGDAAGVAALYTENGQIMPPNSDIIMGREAIQGFWQGGIDMGIKSMQFEMIDIEGMGTTACEVGKYTVYAQGDQMIDKGKYMVIWKQVEGQWLLHRDIWNTSMPMPEE
jgi:uncharacterized protein (TIGR02246 family)